MGDLATPKNVQKLQKALHAKRREVLAESRMREIRQSSSMSGVWEAMAEPVRHRQTKGRQQIRSTYGHRATPRRYPMRILAVPGRR